MRLAFPIKVRKRGKRQRRMGDDSRRSSLVKILHRLVFPGDDLLTRCHRLRLSGFGSTGLHDTISLVGCQILERIAAAIGPLDRRAHRTLLRSQTEVKPSARLCQVSVTRFHHSHLFVCARRLA